jgi:DNA-binding Lrp family transcriptional regulator
MDNQVRIFRDKPFGWFDKPVMRYLREKYGHDKKTFLNLRSTYLAICEMESDFEHQPIHAFNKTVGTYAGLSRQVAGKYVRMLEQEGLIKKTRVINPETNLKARGTWIQMMSSQQVPAISARMAGYPTSRTPDQSDTPPIIKKVGIAKKVSMPKNVWQSPIQTKDKDKVEYYAQLLANKLNDQKSLSFYRIACARHNPEKLLQKAAEIVKDGGARKPGAVFVAWLKSKSL